jgi:hypothetical protein
MDTQDGLDRVRRRVEDLYMRPLSTNLIDDARPYFLWDEDLSVAELRRKLSGGSGPERRRLLAKLLREARDTDVWRFVTPAEVAFELDALEIHLGRRRAFWRYLIDAWRSDGLL